MQSPHFINKLVLISQLALVGSECCRRASSDIIALLDYVV